MAELGATDVTVVANDIGPEGGMERQLTELIGGLLDAGQKVTVVSWTCALPAHLDLKWIRVPGPRRPFPIAYPWFLLLASLIVWLRGAGVVHSTGAIVLARVDVCTVHFCHRAAARLKGLSRASRGGLAYRVNARIAKGMSLLVERWCYRPSRVRRLVGVSEGVARELREHYPDMRGQIEVVPNGIDVDAFHPLDRPAADRRPGDKLVALFVGSEWERKGLRVAIEALAGSTDFDLLVVGDGDADGYRRLAQRHGVAERVTFAGSTENVAAWYRRADVFVLPTSYETFSLVTYEAAASGLPLLVTRVNGVEDLLRDGVNGWFVERDPADVHGRLRRLAAEPGLRMKMGEAARRSSLEHSWPSVVARYGEIYREMAQ